LVNGLQGIRGEYWLGGSQAAATGNPEDDWTWTTGEAWEYTNWAPGEPNDAHGSGSEQHVAVWSMWGSDNWLWNDEGYLPNITGFIAERSHSVPEPAPVLLLAISLTAVFGFTYKRGHQK
jgi:hypothetical protein